MTSIYLSKHLLTTVLSQLRATLFLILLNSSFERQLLSLPAGSFNFHSSASNLDVTNCAVETIEQGTLEGYRYVGGNRFLTPEQLGSIITDRNSKCRLTKCNDKQDLSSNVNMNRLQTSRRLNCGVAYLSVAL